MSSEPLGQRPTDPVPAPVRSDVIIWDYLELDPRARAGLRCILALRRLGYAMPRIGMYLWPKRGASACDVMAACEDMVSLGVEFVIAMDGMAGEHWVHPYRDRITALGLDLSIGLGMDGAWVKAQIAIDAIVAGLDAHSGLVDLDRERNSKWETNAGNALGMAITDGVLTMRPDARPRICEAGWWALLTDMQGHPTHPHFPYRASVKLCGTQRPQCYGAPKRGLSTLMLAHARSDSQYPSIGAPAATVMPTFQGYARDVADHVASIAWEGPDVHAVRAFQASAGITADDIVGPVTCAALGVAWPNGGTVSP